MSATSVRALATATICLYMSSAAADVTVEIGENALGNFASSIEIGGERTDRIKATLPCFAQPFAEDGGHRLGVSPSASGGGGGIQIEREGEVGVELQPSDDDQVIEPEPFAEIAERVREGLEEIADRTCTREIRVPYSWRVSSIEAEITPSEAYLWGTVVVETPNERNTQGFQIPLSFSFNRVRSTLEIDAQRTLVPLSVTVVDEVRVLHNVDFSDHYTVEVPLSGRIETSGRTIDPEAANVSISRRDGSIILMRPVRG